LSVSYFFYVVLQGGVKVGTEAKGTGSSNIIGSARFNVIFDSITFSSSESAVTSSSSENTSSSSLGVAGFFFFFPLVVFIYIFKAQLH
jgi:hypothetical protein